MSQLVFSWPESTSYDTMDFIISGANASAAGFLESWPNGHSYAALLSGPASSGKTHLARHWALQHKAALLDIRALGTKTSQALWGEHTYAVLEDIHTVHDETALFHLLRHAETSHLSLLFTCRSPAAQLPFTLPDLRSRLMALPTAAIAAPDDTLLHAFLAKSFADRQLRVSEDVIAYLVKRIERSFSQAQEWVQRIEKKASETKREITIPLLKALFDYT